MKTIGIVGSRRRNEREDFELVKTAFLKVYEEGDAICSGGCPKGGDRFAEAIARAYHIPINIYYADWKTHGKAAGFIRNTDIAKDSNILIACVAPDRTGGTEDTIRKFLKTKKEEDLILV